MIKTPLIIIIALMISTVANAQVTDNQNPLTKLSVIINGEKYEVNDGESLVVNGDTIVVNVSDIMTFDFGKVVFDYPNHFAFEYEEETGYKCWTLDGNDHVITYFELEAEVELDMFIDEIANEFGRKNCKVVDYKTQLGGIALVGKRIYVDIFGVVLTYDMFKIKTNDHKTHFMGFQDTKEDDGSDSQEGVDARAIIDKTIQMK